MKRVLAIRTPVNTILATGALGLVLAAHSGFAQQGGSQAAGAGEAWQASFNDVDTNSDNVAEWQELTTNYDRQLQEAGWGEQQVLDRFDHNNDGVLDNPEYTSFMTALDSAQRTASTGGQQQNQQAQQQQSQNQVTQQGGPGNQQGQQDQLEDRVVLQEEEREALQPEVAGLPDQPDQQAEQTEQDMVAQQNQRDQQSQQPQQDQMAQNMQGQQGQQGQQNQQAGNQQGQQATQGDVTTVVAVTTVQEVPIADIEDRQVVNLQGEQIGKVEDVVVSEESDETGLVVSVGGFLGIGDKDVYVSLNDVSIRAEEVVWETMVGEDELKELPEYNEQDYVSVR